jgi:hypothetical protein
MIFIYMIVVGVSCYFIGSFFGAQHRSNERKNWEDTRQSLDNDDKLDDTEI